MKTLYVPFEEVITIIMNYYPLYHNWTELEDFIGKVESLPTIDLSIIDEMIEEKEKEYEWIPVWEATYKIWYVIALKELKEKLSLKN